MRPASSCLVTTYGGWMEWKWGIRITKSPWHALQESLQETGEILLGSGYLEVNRVKTWGEELK